MTSPTEVESDLIKRNFVKGELADLHFERLAVKIMLVGRPAKRLHAGSASVTVLDIALELIRMRPGVQDDLLDPSICKALKRIVDNRLVHEGEKALESSNATAGLTVSFPLLFKAELRTQSD